MNTETNTRLRNVCYILFAFFAVLCVVKAGSSAHAATAPDQTETLLKQTKAKAYEEGFKAGQIDGMEAMRDVLQQEISGSAQLMVTFEGETWEIARIPHSLNNPMNVCNALAIYQNKVAPTAHIYTCLLSR